MRWLLLFTLTGGLWAQPALVSHTSAGALSTFTTSAINTTGATVIGVCMVGTGAGLGTLSDNQGNTWQAGPTATNTHQSRLSYVINPNTGASHTFTVTGGSAVSIDVVALSGTGLLDTSSSSNGGGGSALTTIQPGSITPGAANDAFITCLGAAAAGTYSINGIFTLTDQKNYVNAVNFGSAAAWATEASTTALNPTYTVTSATRLSAEMIALRQQVAGPTISSVAYTNLSANSAVLTWTTSANADSQVLCGATGGASGTYGTYVTQVSDPVQIGVSDAWGVTSHRLGVTLPASYSGHCIARSTNQAGGQTSSSDLAVTTPAAAAVIPIGIATVGPRLNLTRGFTDATHGGFNGDIAHQTIAGDGAWYQANNDGLGKSICNGNNCYCCTGHNLISKWPTQFTRSMLLGMDSSTQGAPVNTVFGGGSSNQAITSGTCSGNVASITIQNWQWTYPAGTAIYVTGANPSTYNVAGATVLASPAPTNTTLSYTATCGSTALVSGGAINLWNDGNHQLTFGIDSAQGLMCINTWRANSNNYQHRICTTDYWAHSFVDANNRSPAAGGPIVVPGMDAPYPSQRCLLGNCTSVSIIGLMLVSACPDNGGLGQTLPCKYYAGDDVYNYYISPALSGAGIVIIREPVADRYRLNAIDQVGSSTLQEYTGAAACDDRGLYSSNWTSTITRTHVINTNVASYGNTPVMVAAPDFNEFLLTNWLALPTTNISQSSGSTVYSTCGWPWGIATPIGSVNRDETDIQFFGTFGFLVPGTYATIDTTPGTRRASVAFRQSGSYLNQNGNSTTNEYGANYYTINLAERWTGAKGAAGPQFSYNGSANKFPRNGLDLLYTFQDPSGTTTITNSSPNDTQGTYNATTPAQNLVQLVDRYGLYSPGFVGTCPAAGTGNCLYGGTNITPYPFFLTTLYTTPPNGTDFLAAVIFNHVDSASSGPPSGECVLNRAALKICRNGTTANSWIVTVGATASSALSVTCDGAGNFCGLLVNRVNGVATVYATGGLPSNPLSVTALATINDATALGSDALVLGAKSDGTLQFQGWLTMAAMYSFPTGTSPFGTNQLIQLAAAMRSHAAVRGITLP